MKTLLIIALCLLSFLVPITALAETPQTPESQEALEARRVEGLKRAVEKARKAEGPIRSSEDAGNEALGSIAMWAALDIAAEFVEKGDLVLASAGIEGSLRAVTEHNIPIVEIVFGYLFLKDLSKLEGKEEQGIEYAKKAATALDQGERYYKSILARGSTPYTKFNLCMFNKIREMYSQPTQPGQCAFVESDRAPLEARFRIIDTLERFDRALTKAKNADPHKKRS